MVFGSIVGADNYGTHSSKCNQDKMWCVNIVEFMGFGPIVGFDYSQQMPPRNLTNNVK